MLYYDAPDDSDDTSLLAIHSELIPIQQKCCCKSISFPLKYICDPSRCSYRYILLSLICFIQVAVYYCIEMPGGLEESIINIMEVDTTRYGLLFSLIAWPNIIICLVGGVLIDRVVGLRLGFVIVTIIALIGQLVFAFGAIIGEFWVMLAGRFMLGIGVELIFIISHSFEAVWFKNKELSFAISIDISCSRLGGALALTVNQPIYQTLNFISNTNYRLGATIMVGVLVLIASLLCCIIIILLDIRGAKLLRRETFKMKNINCQDVKEFSISFWLVVGACIIYYPVVISFSGIGQLFFIKKYGFSINEANVVNSLVFWAVIIGTPLLGLVVDVVGFNVYWSMAGISTAILCHAMYALDNGVRAIPYIAGIIYSISYSLFASSMWPVPALIIQEHQIATAYGLLKCPYSISFSIITVVTGVLVDSNGYLVLELFYLLLLYIAFVLMTFLWILEITDVESKVNISGWTRRKAKAEKEKAMEKKETINIEDDLFSYSLPKKGLTWQQ